MHKKILAVMSHIPDEALKDVITSIMGKYHDAFINEPAGCSKHHAYDGGLLHHSCGTAMLAASMADMYARDGLNKSIVVTGALLHDIGKVLCYEKVENPKGPMSPKYRSTQKSRWHHHIPIGFHIVATETDRMVSANKLDADIADHLLHIIVSHHGRVEYRSPRTPETDEAFIVSQADLMDAYMGASKHAKNTFNKERSGK